jgi:hypothetical protein
MRRHRLCLLLGAALGAPQPDWAASSNDYAGPCGNESTVPGTQAFTVVVNTKPTDAHIINSTAPGRLEWRYPASPPSASSPGSAMVVRCVSVWRESLPPPRPGGAQSRKSARERRSVWLRWNARTFVVAYACPSCVLPDERGGITTIDAAGVRYTIPFGINNRGQIAGSTSADLVNLTGARGFLIGEGRQRSLHADRHPGRANLGHRHQRSGPDRRRLRESSGHARSPAEPHAVARHDVGTLDGR